MKRLKKILFLALMVTALSCLFCQPAFAISEEEVQAQVDAVGKEAVSGNVLIWFMCAIGFLKVSQKIDSFMASLRQCRPYRRQYAGGGYDYGQGIQRI